MLKRLLLAACCLCLSSQVSALDVFGVEVHGFASQGYFKTTQNNYLIEDSSRGSFAYNELGINFSKNLTDRLRVGVQFFARNLGHAGNDDVIIDWAVFDYHWKDYLGVCLGKIKIPYGLYNESRDIDSVRTFILLPQAFYDDLVRDYQLSYWGGQLYGIVPISKFGEVEYKAFVGTYIINISNPFVQNQLELKRKAYQVNKLTNISETERGIYGGSLVWTTPLDGLRLGTTTIWGNIMTDVNAPVLSAIPGQLASADSEGPWSRWTVSAEYTYKKLTAAAEFFNATHLVDTTIRFPALLIPALPPGHNILPASTSQVRRELQFEGYYGSLEYRFTDRFRMGTYYSVFYPDRQRRNSSPANYQRDLDLTVRFDINKYVVVKVEAHQISGYGQTLYIFNTDQSKLKKDWNLFVTKVTCSF